MHRSGTSLVSRMLEGCGLFLGKKKDKNNEALFFQRLNNWLLRQSGGSWDYPQPIHLLIQNKEVFELIEDYTRYYLKTWRIISFLGVKKCLQYTSLWNTNFPWGWKDPRNTFTLPLWLRLFPNAKVIHVFRHGVDVASSLKRRQERRFRYIRTRYKKIKPLYFFRGKTGGFTPSLRCKDLGRAFTLWEEYRTEAEIRLKVLNNPVMNIKYEDLLSDPRPKLSELSMFCGLEVSAERIRKVANMANKERMYAYQSNSELRNFAVSVRYILERFGYAD